MMKIIWDRRWCWWSLCGRVVTDESRWNGHRGCPHQYWDCDCDCHPTHCHKNDHNSHHSNPDQPSYVGQSWRSIQSGKGFKSHSATYYTLHCIALHLLVLHSKLIPPPTLGQTHHNILLQSACITLSCIQTYCCFKLQEEEKYIIAANCTAHTTLCCISIHLLVEVCFQLFLFLNFYRNTITFSKWIPEHGSITMNRIMYIILSCSCKIIVSHAGLGWGGTMAQCCIYNSMFWGVLHIWLSG